MLGFAFLVIHGLISQRGLVVALKSPFKFLVPMTPGECLYLEGGTFLDGSDVPTDFFRFFPKKEVEDEDIQERYHYTRAKPIPWTELLRDSTTSTAEGASILVGIKEFRDKVLHPHVASLYEKNDFYAKFVEDIRDERFKVTDLDLMSEMFEKWKVEEEEKKEKKKLKRKEIENAFAESHKRFKQANETHQETETTFSTEKSVDENISEENK